MADKEKPKKTKRPFSVSLAIFFVLLTFALFFPTTVLLCGCLLPAFVAAIVDDNPVKTAWMTVGAMNMVGAMPSLFQLWAMGHRVDQAIGLLMQPQTLLMAYGGAAAGWAIYNYVPLFVASIIAKRGEKRLRDIEARQKDLVRKWGQGVMS